MQANTSLQNLEKQANVYYRSLGNATSPIKVIEDPTSSFLHAFVSTKTIGVNLNSSFCKSLSERTLTKILPFSLAHEVGHIHHKHHAFAFGETIRTVFLVASAAFLFFISSPLYFAFYIGTVLCISHIIIPRITHYFELIGAYFSQNQEFEADLAALQVTNDFEGAKLLFEKGKNFQKKQWAKLSLYDELYTLLLHPEKLLPISHPSWDQRLTHLQKFSQKSHILTAIAPSKLVLTNPQYGS